MAVARTGGDFKITVKGNERLARTLRRAGAELSDLEAAGRKAGDVIVQRARTLCPVRTGALQGSIHIQSVKSGVTVAAGQGLVYAGVQHWGWPAHNIRATLFLTRAFTETRAQQVTIYSMDVRRAMSQVQGA